MPLEAGMASNWGRLVFDRELSAPLRRLTVATTGVSSQRFERLNTQNQRRPEFQSFDNKIRNS